MGHALSPAATEGTSGRPHDGMERRSTMTVAVQAVGAVVQPPAQARTERVAHLPALTGLRFLAALVVVIDHAGYGPLAAMVAPFGGVAVTLFFILSGFILTYTYTRNGTAVHGGW